MTTFKDGPANGKSLMLKRSPLLLRVVISGGNVDALDQLEDRPARGETCFAYVLAARPGACHIRLSGGRGGFYPMAEYQMSPVQPSQKVMHDETLWREWCVSHKHLVPQPRESSA